MSKIQKVVRLHFALLIFVLFNFALHSAIGFGINHNLVTAAKAILYLSGIFLFFASLRPFKAIAIYFSFFAMTPVVITLFYFVGGIFLALLSSIFLAPIMPLESEYSKDNVKIYSRFNGFLGRCCNYSVTQNTLYIFEMHKGDIDTDGSIDFQKSNITLEHDSIRIDPDTVLWLNK